MDITKQSDKTYNIRWRIFVEVLREYISSFSDSLVIPKSEAQQLIVGISV